MKITILIAAMVVVLAFQEPTADVIFVGSSRWDYVRGTWGEPLSCADFDVGGQRMIVMSFSLSQSLFPSYRSRNGNLSESQLYRRLTGFVTCDVGAQKGLEFGVRFPFVRVKGGYGPSDPSEAGAGDILVRARLELHRAVDNKGQIIIGAGVKLPTGQSEERALSLGTGTVDVALGLYGAGHWGSMPILGYLGYAHVVAESEYARSGIERTMTFEGELGLPVSWLNTLFLGINGYKQIGEESSGSRVSLGPRLQVTNSQRSANLEVGFITDVEGRDTMVGLTVFVNIGIRSDLSPRN